MPSHLPPKRGVSRTKPQPRTPRLKLPLGLGVDIGVEPDVRVDYKEPKVRAKYGKGWSVPKSTTQAKKKQVSSE